MSLLSFVAIITSVLAGLILRFSEGYFWFESKEDTPKWKRVVRKVLQGVDFDVISSRRRFWLKLILSMLLLVAFGCGFADQYYASTLTGSLRFWCFVGALFFPAVSVGVVLAICFLCIDNFKDLIKESRFGLEEGSLCTIAINIGYICIWVAMFILLIWCGGRTVFSLISLSLLFAVGVSFVLTILGFFFYAVYRCFYCIIVYPLVCWIRWLRK